MKHAFLSIILTTAAVVSLNAQENSPVAFQVGGGFTTSVGRTGTYLDTGWNISAGVGYNFSQYFGALLNISDNELGINSSTLGNIGVPGGNVNLFTATIDPIVHLVPKSHIDFYITGGAGLIRRNQEFTTPSVTTTYGYNPFFGFYPAIVPTTQILSSYSVNKPGLDAGIGIALGTKWHGKIYAEAKYYRMFYNESFHTDFLPVTFGYRW